MSLRDDLIPVVDDARGLVAELGLRPRSVAHVVRSWSGGKLGSGTLSETGIVLTPTPRVAQVSERMAGLGGIYEAGDLLVTQVSARYEDAWLRGSELGAGEELLYEVDGAPHTLISAELRALEWRLVIRRRR